ncbi:hypothetical protein EJ06DRAFT_519723 [Trichodelitschia bisporula]|uniref:Uncharacterized protein n=1 Tax=Trichodelitschia bisporula TaxID=703511 RepID=A0A6G1I344_9PEZI|nr:hypothetical protein EJ06DRAFT_519723 [Trichodelitschia bisporula]
MCRAVELHCTSCASKYEHLLYCCQWGEACSKQSRMRVDMTIALLDTIPFTTRHCGCVKLPSPAEKANAVVKLALESPGIVVLERRDSGYSSISPQSELVMMDEAELGRLDWPCRARLWIGAPDRPCAVHDLGTPERQNQIPDIVFDALDAHAAASRGASYEVMEGFGCMPFDGGDMYQEGEYRSVDSMMPNGWTSPEAKVEHCGVDDIMFDREMLIEVLMWIQEDEYCRVDGIMLDEGMSFEVEVEHCDLDDIMLAREILVEMEIEERCFGAIDRFLNGIVEQDFAIDATD